MKSRHSRLSASRAQFRVTLERRLETLNAALTGLATDDDSGVRAANLRRRLEAMAEAASVLGFFDLHQVFADAAHHLSQQVPLRLGDLETVRGLLASAPSLMPSETELEDSPPSSGLGRASEQVAPNQLTELGPATIVALGCPEHDSLAQLRKTFAGATQLSLHYSVERDQVRAWTDKYDPELVLVDARRADAAASVGELGARSRLVVVESLPAEETEFKRAGAALVAGRGEGVAAAILKALSHPPALPSVPVDAGAGTSPVDPLTLAELADQVAAEVKTALLSGVRSGDPTHRLDVGDNGEVRAAVWSAISRLRGIVDERSGGAVTFTDDGPEGAVLVAPTQRGQRSLRDAADRENLRGARVLVADDDPSVAWFLASVLRAEGAQVIEAQDGLDAWHKARTQQPDLVISDVLMPHLDGFGLCRNIKRDIVLSDVPVILLSWKEDLLQRVRELGVGADGYLAKEAEADTIVLRAAEALRTRARIRHRLSSETVVYGRLDGVTPRLVLQLACELPTCATTVFHDAAFTYKAYLGDARLLAVERVSKSGERECGASVLAALVGMRAGRFVVERTTELVQAEFFGSLSKVLAPHISRIRRAVEVLQGATLPGIRRLDLDRTTIAPYLELSPQVVRELYAQLERGAAPAALLSSVSAGLLESVLLDLALRGAVVGVVNDAGIDLLAQGAEPSLLPYDTEVRTPTVGMGVAAAAGATAIDSNSSPEDVKRAAEFAERIQSERAQATTQSDRAPVGDSAPPLAITNGDTGAPPEPAQSAPVMSEGPVLDELADQSQGASSTRPEAAAAASSAALESGAASQLATPASTRERTERAPLREEKPEVQQPEGEAIEMDLADAVFGGFLAAAEPSPPTPPRSVEAAKELERAAEPSPPTPPRSVEAAKELERAREPNTRATPKLPGAVAESEVLQESAPAVVAPQDEKDDRVAPSGQPAEVPVSPIDRVEAGPEQDSPVSEEGVKEPAARSEAEDAGSTGQAPAVDTGPQSARGIRRVLRNRHVRAVGRVVAPAGALLGATAAAYFAASAVMQQPRSNSEDAAQRSVPAPEQAQLELRTRPGAADAPGSSAVRPSRAPTRASLASDTAAESGRSDPRQLTLTPTEMPLPEGVTVAENKGLLEISTEGKHRIYIDRVFIGRGPVRRVPLRAGSHQVKTRLDGREDMFEVTVAAGKRTRLQPAK